jgi:hypothetical protein
MRAPTRCKRRSSCSQNIAPEPPHIVAGSGLRLDAFARLTDPAESELVARHAPMLTESIRA